MREWTQRHIEELVRGILNREGGGDDLMGVPIPILATCNGSVNATVTLVAIDTSILVTRTYEIMIQPMSYYFEFNGDTYLYPVGAGGVAVLNNLRGTHVVDGITFVGSTGPSTIRVDGSTNYLDFTTVKVVVPSNAILGHKYKFTVTSLSPYI